jgi:E3 ubiquitin-protein ligase listerin
VTAILEKAPELLDLSLISQYVIYDAPKSNLTGSASDYVESLKRLTAAHPEIWTSAYAGSEKRSATRGLSHLLRKGSNGASENYWSILWALLEVIPEPIILSSRQDEQAEDPDATCPGHSLLEDMVAGISRREDRRQDNKAAWDTYLNLTHRILSLSKQARSKHFSDTHILPIILQYIAPSTETVQWTVTTDQLRICTKAAKTSAHRIESTTDNALLQISTGFIRRLQTSLPEQSNDYMKSQDAVIRDARRWYELLNRIYEAVPNIQESIQQCMAEERNAALEIVKQRNGKPYGAAAVLDLQCRCFPTSTVNKEAVTQLVSFARAHVPQLSTSPSAPYLLRLLDTLNAIEDVSSAYEASLGMIEKAPDSAGRTKALETLLASPWPHYRRAQSSLETLVQHSLEDALSGHNEAWDTVRLLLRNSSVPQDVTDDILSKIIDSLSIKERAAEGLNCLDSAIQENKSGVRAYLSSGKGKGLFPQLLFLSQSPDGEDLRDHARNLQAAIDRLMSSDNASTDAASSVIEAIGSRVLQTGPASIKWVDAYIMNFHC